MTLSFRPREKDRLRAFARDRRGVSVVEFAVVLPLFGMLLAGTADFGGVLYARFTLNGALSSSANYAQLHATEATSASGGNLAQTIGAIVAGNSSWANGTVVVNNGPSATITSGAVASGGTAANADSCYCPTLATAGLAWGSAQTCGASCSSGGVAGKFVTVSLSRNYTSMFARYGFVQTGAVVERTVVQVQ